MKAYHGQRDLPVTSSGDTRCAGPRRQKLGFRTPGLLGPFPAWLDQNPSALARNCGILVSTWRGHDQRSCSSRTHSRYFLPCQPGQI